MIALEDSPRSLTTVNGGVWSENREIPVLRLVDSEEGSWRQYSSLATRGVQDDHTNASSVVL